MTTAGIDLGAKFVKVLFLKDDEVLARTQERAGFEPIEAARRAFAAALSECGLTENDLDAICATGADGDLGNQPGKRYTGHQRRARPGRRIRSREAQVP